MFLFLPLLAQQDATLCLYRGEKRTKEAKRGSGFIFPRILTG